MMVVAGLGVAVGIILAVTGAGGGILAVPVLMFGAGLSLAQAAPVALMAVGMAALAGSIHGLKRGLVRYKAAFLIAACGAPFAPLGLALARQVDSRILTVVFALVLGWVALRMLRQDANAFRAPGKFAPCQRDAVSGRLRWNSRCARALFATGATAGFFSGLLGVGGGFVIVPALRRSTDLELDAIVATSLAVIAMVCASTVASSALQGTLAWHLALPFAGGAMAGMLGGRALAPLLGPRAQQLGFAWLALTVAIAMAVKTLS